MGRIVLFAYCFAGMTCGAAVFVLAAAALIPTPRGAGMLCCGSLSCVGFPIDLLSPKIELTASNTCRLQSIVINPNRSTLRLLPNDALPPTEERYESPYAESCLVPNKIESILPKMMEYQDPRKATSKPENMKAMPTVFLP